MGKYLYIGEYGISSNIELLPNQTYKYEWSAGLITGVSLGQWKFENGFVILNSEKQPSKQITESNEIIQELVKSENIVTIKVVDDENKPVPFVNCLLNLSNSNEKDITNENGICKFETIEAIEKIVLSYIGFKTVEYNPNAASNYFVIQLRKTHENYEFFTNEKWKLKGNELIRTNKKGEQTSYKKIIE